MKHRVELETLARKIHARKYCEQPPEGPWILRNINDYKHLYAHDDGDEEVEEEEFEWDTDDDEEAVEFEWNSEDDDVLNIEDMVEGTETFSGYISCIGFHPHKEVIFLNVSLERGVAYHWNSSKIQDLGDIEPVDYPTYAGDEEEIEKYFPYTPCWMEDFPETKWEALIED